MSKVQELEYALSQLSPGEFREVEQWIHSWKQRPAAPDDEGYALREYGVSQEELERFDQRMLAKVAEAEANGTLRPFSGDLEKDIEE